MSSRGVAPVLVLGLALAGCSSSSLSADDQGLCERDAVYVEVLREDLGATLADRHWSTKHEAAAIAEVAVRPLLYSLRGAQPQDPALRQAMSGAASSLTDLVLTMGITDGGADALADDARLLRAAVEDLDALAEVCG